MPNQKNTAAPNRPIAAPAAFRLSPRDILQMFQERWFLGLIIGAAAAIIFVVLQPAKEPVYYSEVSLLFESRKDRVLNIQEVVDTGVHSQNELRIHEEQLRSQTFFDYMLTSFNREEAARIQKA